MMPRKSYLNLPCIQMIVCLFIIKIGIVLWVHYLCVAFGEDQESDIWE